MKSAKKSVLLVLLSNRRKEAIEVQKILTGWGCMIKTRLGIHDGVMDRCGDTGLIILELVGDAKSQARLKKELAGVKGVTAKLVELSVK